MKKLKQKFKNKKIILKLLTKMIKMIILNFKMIIIIKTKIQTYLVKKLQMKIMNQMNYDYIKIIIKFYKYLYEKIKIK